jgi:DNA-binding transcriptional LysR family regulator
MNETKIEWSDLDLFLAVARGGGLAAGATISGLSAPTLGRHMVVLERAVGEALFNRLPRGYELTEAGVELLTEAESVEEQFLGIQRRRDNRNAQLPIHITAGTWMTRFLVMHIRDISTQGSRLVFRAAETRHHIGRREATIGLRNTRPEEAALAARKTTRIAFAPYATPSAVQQSDWIATTAQTPSANWVRTHKKNQIRFQVTSPRSLLDLALQGAGHAVLPCFVGCQEPELVRSGPIIPSLSHDQWLVVHGEDRNQPPVRRTVDLIAKLIVSARSAFEGNE